MGECNVKVVVRFRPFNEREKQENVNSDLSVAYPDDSSVQVLQGGKVKNTFNLDRVLTPTVTQEEVFDATARATVQDVVNGYNGTIFAYGQTGAGKSFSMFGPDITSPQRGIIPRACAFIFDYIRDQANDVEVTIKCSFLEIYKETIRDLLNPTSNNLKVRETPSRGVWVDDLTEQYVTNDREVIALLQLGEKFRSVSATQMNAVSSRSHSLFVLTLQQKGRDGSTKTGKLNLADLAGSEKVEKTGAKGDTLEEAKKINQSLSALGNCINALTKAKRGHVPYRDSKLTFLLRESLGGNSKTTLIVCCSGHKFNMEETSSSLQFAQRAKSIKNTVKVNRQRSVEELNRIIQKLSKELELLKIYCQSIEQEVLKLNPKFDLAFAKKQAIPSMVPVAAPSSPALTSSSGGSPASSVRDDASDMSFDDAQDMNFDFPTEDLTMAELQVELERLRESSSLQLREHAEEIENLKDENENFRRTVTTLEEECKNEKNASTLLRTQLQTEQAKNETLIHKLEYENKQQKIEVESLSAAKTNLENHNKSLQESIKKERELLQRSKSTVDLKTQVPVVPSTSASMTLPSRKPETARPAISTQSPSLKPPPQLPHTALIAPQPGSRPTSVQLPPRFSYRQAKDEAGLENEALSLEELLQQSDVDIGYIQMLSNDLEALQFELNSAQTEIINTNKQIDSRDLRIAQLEEELKKQVEVETSLRTTLEQTVSESAQKEIDLNSKIFYLEEATKVAKQREVVRVVRPIEAKPQASVASSIFSSLFDTAVKDVPSANSLTHCFKQGFLTKQGSMIKTWKKRFAVLQGNTLYYYSPDPKKEPRGRYDLDSLCVVQEADDFTQKPFSLGIFHPMKQPFYCIAESLQDRLEWIEAFKAACTVSPMQNL